MSALSELLITFINQELIIFLCMFDLGFDGVLSYVGVHAMRRAIASSVENGASQKRGD